ncbi:MAG: hypothetical protein Q4D88_03500 [Anaerococcus sp.]|nr:hypothetical protein [Anaerococcus sp.]
MNKIKSLSSFIWGRFYLFLLPMIILFTIILSFGSKNSLEYEYESFIKSLNFMKEDISNENFGENPRIDEEFLKETRILAYRYKNKHGFYSSDYLDKMSDEAVSDYYDSLDSDDMWEKEMHYSIYSNFMSGVNEKGLDISEHLASLLPIISFFIVIFAILITSIEESMPIYEFTRMLPWKNTEDLAMKAMITFVLSLGILAINSLALVYVLRGTGFANIIDYTSIYPQLGKNVLILLAISLIAVSLGFIAGNFIGHMGLGIIAMFGSYFIIYNIELFSISFNNTIKIDFPERFYAWVGGLSPFKKTLVSFMNLDTHDYGSIMGFILIAVLIFALALVVAKGNLAERSGYMVISRPISIICKFLAVITFANIIPAFFLSFFLSENVILATVLYIVSLLISYKFFDMLFNIRLKF